VREEITEMSRRKTWVVIGLVTLLVGGAVTGAVGLRAARAAEGKDANLLPADAPGRPLAKLFRENAGRFREMLRGLGLSAEQRQEIRTILKSHREEIRTIAREVREQHQKVREAAQADPLNEAAVRQAAEGMAKGIGDAAVLHAKIRREVMAKLTPEQIKKVESFRNSVHDSVDKALAAAGNR
jgi:Spy/CpxP family protein refolding chaperone